MLDQTKFMEMLMEIVQIGRSQNNYLTKDEIKQYFGDMQLKSTDYKHVYVYLAENKIQVEDFEYTPSIDLEKEMEQEEYKNKPEEENKENQEDSIYLKMYLEDISYQKKLTLAEENEFFSLLLQGKEEVKEYLVGQFLYEVVNIAKEYRNKGVALEDLIQEGNIGLLKAVQNIKGIQIIADCRNFLLDSIRQEIEQVIDSKMSEEDWETTVLAKTNLISEAAKYLAEDYGRVATRKELAEYTKLSEEEIQDVLELSFNAIQLGVGE